MVENQSPRPFEYSQLPLEPIQILKAKAEAAWREGAKNRLDGILALPLHHMVNFIDEDDCGRVICLLCLRKEIHLGDINWMRKEDWAAWHFRAMHWNLYEEMTTATFQVPPRHNFSRERWITLEDITSDYPILSDEEVLVSTTQMTFSSDAHGPFLLRRFVVVREGLNSCLCLGIHT